MTKLTFFVTTTTCYAAIETAHGIIQDSYVLGVESQSAALIPFIKSLWDRAGNPPITTLIAPKGPGSFTALRVTLATAQGLSIAFPAATSYAPTFFDVLLYGLPEQSYALIDSKRGDYFVKAKMGEPLILTPEAFVEFQSKHFDWAMIVEPDLFGNDFIMQSGVNMISYDPEQLLGALLAADTYAQPSEFQPYYLFEPVFKKSSSSVSLPSSDLICGSTR